LAKISAGKASELKPGAMRKVETPDKDPVLVANVDGKFYAIRELCNHQGGPLSEGELEGNVVTCPWHGSKWDVTTGALVDFAIELDPEPSYKVTQEGDELFVDA